MIYYLALGVLLALSVFFIIKNYHDNQLINRAAKALQIPDRFVFFLRNDLLSLYKYQPYLKVYHRKNYPDDVFLLMIKQNDKAHYNCIINKLHSLIQREEEYGEGFFDEYSHAF